MNQKEYNFKYSKKILGLESLSVLVTLALSAYLYYEKEHTTLAIIFLIIGLSNSIYYLTRIKNKTIQLKINEKGMTLKKQFISWSDIEEIKFDRISTGSVSSNFIIIMTKSDKDYDLEISELNVSPKKLKEIISNYRKSSFSVKDRFNQSL